MILSKIFEADLSCPGIYFNGPPNSNNTEKNFFLKLVHIIIRLSNKSLETTFIDYILEYEPLKHQYFAMNY